MRPAPYSLVLYRGDTARYQFRLWADTAKTVPCDLTGVRAAAQVMDKPSGTAILDFVCTVTLPNIVDVVLPANVSRNLPTKGGVWDLQLTYPSLDVVTVLAGKVCVTADVTESVLVPMPV